MRNQTTARVTGALFLTATAAGVLSAVLLGPLDTRTGALAVLVMTLAILMIPPTLFPVLKQHGEAAALGYVAARVVEVVTLLPAAVGALIGVTQAMWGHVSMVFFCLSVVLLNGLLFRSRLVPNWIAGWALVAVVPYLTDACLLMLGGLDSSSPIHGLLVAPLAVNEMVLAGWLLVKGFRETNVRAPHPVVERG
jgi:hypothetical protein